ncbi:Unknown protein [Striga hermonthica]|uniref:Uncharacterized protein n=1 Tax=Striga hermonthica TaxID=68872 RepID=A0A9N7NCT4_STRHE|nr:Unknown protein [Striga hermonthica]
MSQQAIQSDSPSQQAIQSDSPSKPVFWLVGQRCKPGPLERGFRSIGLDCYDLASAMAEVAALFDASAYVLFESIGDSEADQFDGDPVAADDDAESCSRGSAPGGAREEVAGGEDEGNRRDRVDEEDGGGSDLEDGVVDQCRGGGEGSPPQAAEMKMMSEREGDRLFWEACLASRD